MNDSAVAARIAETALPRAAASDEPHRYRRAVRDRAEQLAAGHDTRLPYWATPLEQAADIEARAGLRAVAAARHSKRCACDACQVRTAVAHARRVAARDIRAVDVPLPRLQADLADRARTGALAEQRHQLDPCDTSFAALAPHTEVTA